MPLQRGGRKDCRVCELLHTRSMCPPSYSTCGGANNATHARLERRFEWRPTCRVLRSCREAEEGIAMPKSAHLRLILTDVDPTMSVAQTVRAEERVHAQTLRKLPIEWKVSLSAALFASAIVLTSTGLNESPHQATAIMERLAAKAEAARQITPETQDAVFELLATPHYNCERIKCDEQLTARNRLARERLRNAIFGASIAAGATEHDINVLK
jgi:hypothetical protein